MDIVYIEGLETDTVIGIFDWERKIRQTVRLDLELGTDIRAAAASDAIADTLDYKAISERVLGFIQTSEFELVETLAEALARLLRDEFQIPWLRLKLSKPGALGTARDVGVIIERGERPATGSH